MRLRTKKWAMPLIEEHPDVVVNDQVAQDLKGKWGGLFGNNKPIYLEIGSGKGRFIIENAKKYPEINFIGLEIQVTATGIILKNILDLESKLPNLRIILGDGKSVENYFQKAEITKIYLNHSDPWPKAKHEKRRLTYKDFLKSYKAVLPDNGIVEFKTDNKDLFDYSLESFREFGMTFDEDNFSYDLHNEIQKNPDNIVTEYETKFSNLGQVEYWVRATMPL